MQDGAVHIREKMVTIQVLEVFIETIFAGTLEGISNERRGPSEEDTAQTFFGVDGAPGGEVGAVDVRVNLATAFHHVQRSDRGVSWSYVMSGSDTWRTSMLSAPTTGFPIVSFDLVL